MPPLSPTKELRKLFRDSFADGELRTLIVDYYPELEYMVAWDRPRDNLAQQVADALRAQQLVNAQLFDILMDDRKAFATAIEAVRALWFPPPGEDPTDTHMACDRPFLDRTDLRTHTRAMLGGDGPRLTLIVGGDLVGKSFTKYFLTHLEATTRRLRPWIFDFAAPGRGEVHPAEIADTLAADMELKLPAFDTLDGQIPHRTRKWIEAFDRVASKLEPTWCLFFDSLDKVETPESTKEFLEALAAQIDLRRVLPVRMIFVGLQPTSLKIENLRPVAKVEPIPPVQRKHVVDWIGRETKQAPDVVEQELSTELSPYFNGVSSPPPKYMAGELAALAATLIAKLKSKSP